MSQNPQRPEIIDVEVIDPIRSEAAQSMKTYTMIVYGMFALGLFLGGWPAIIGVIMAYVKRSSFAGTIFGQHLGLLIRTFWYSVLVSIVGVLTTWLYIGFVILFAVAVWYIYRLIRGFARLTDGKGAW